MLSKKLWKHFLENRFIPIKNDFCSLPTSSGFYLICTPQINSLPPLMRNLNFKLIEKDAVIYVGIAGSKNGLRNRIRTHFKGTARNSTLRKSLGVLFGYTKVQTESEKGTSKYKFLPYQERELKYWMFKNLTVRYAEAINPEIEEIFLVSHFRPNLNIVYSYFDDLFIELLVNMRKIK